MVVLYEACHDARSLEHKVKENEISQNINHPEEAKAMNRTTEIGLRTEQETANPYKLTRLYNSILIWQFQKSSHS